MGGNFWTRDTGPSGTTTTYEVAMTESLSYTIVNDRYLTRIFVDSAIASGQTLTLSLASGGTWLQTVSVFNQSSTESITVTNGSESFSLAPGNEEAFYIYSGTLYNTSSQYAKLASDNTFSGDNTFTGATTFSGDTTFSSAPLAEAGIQLTSGRKFAEEPSDVPYTISTEGWYQVAYLDTSSVETGSADFEVWDSGEDGYLKCHIAAVTTGVAMRTHQNTHIKITSQAAKTEDIKTTTGFPSVRLAVGSSATSGMFLEVYCGSAISGIYPSIKNNFGAGNEGWQLMAPVASTGLTPDGSTATYLEAGTEYGELESWRIPPTIVGYKFDSSQIRVQALWPDFPKQDATDLTITYPGNNLYLVDGEGTTIELVDGDITIGSVEISGKLVSFVITQADQFASLNVGALHFKPSGAGLNFTLS